MFYNKIQSSLKSYPTSNLIYSSLSAFLDQGIQEIPGMWFVNALSELGHSEGSIRQNLFRMTKTGELIARKVGRSNTYRPGPYMEREILAGRSRILDAPSGDWDGNWTLVHYSTSTNDRNARERIRSILDVNGFAPMGTGLFAHPSDHSGHVIELAEEMGLQEMVRVFRARLCDRDGGQGLIQDLWDLGDLAKTYRKFVEVAAQIEKHRHAATSLQAFQLRYFVVLEFLNVAWRDPGLPLDLLPKDWPGHKAKELAKALYLSLLEPSREYFETVLRELDYDHAD